MQRQQLSEKSDRTDGSTTPRRWTYRGVGSDHEIVVRLRESTPTSGDEGYNGESKSDHSIETASVVLTPPERLQCVVCKKARPTKDFWWCRTCQKTLCSSCNLLQGHTEHRTAPWRSEELVRSLVDTVEARCTARSVRASEEEAAIKEYMREIENYFLSKLRNQLDERNNEDRGLMKAVSASTGVTYSNRTGWPAAYPPAPVSRNGTSTDLAQFSSLLTDDSLARLVKEIRDRLLSTADGVHKLTVTKWPRIGSASPATNSPTASPIINGRSTEGVCDEEDEIQGLVNVTQHFYSFAAVLPNVEPLEFAQMLEQQREFSPRLRSRSHSGLPTRGLTPTIERVSSRAQSPGPHGSNTTTANLTVYGAVDVDGEHKKQVFSADQTQLSPPSNSSARSEFFRGDYQRRSIPGSTVPVVSRTTTTTHTTHVVQATISHDGSRETPPPSADVSTEPVTRRGIPKSDSNASDFRRRFSLPSRHKSGSKAASPPLADTSAESNLEEPPKRQRQHSTPNGAIANGNSPISVTAFHFGEDFLTRPIDIRPLDNDLLAVSDSCGGLYITDSRGSVQRQIWLDGNSASSLCYVPFFPDQPRRPPILLVSVLGKTDRSVRFYDTNKFSLLDEIPAPTQPEIDLGRSRWLSTDDRGAIFMISGDGKMSALWKFHAASPKLWLLLKQAPHSRYQYLDVVQHLANASSVTLLTCNGIQGCILMITVSRAGKILAEQDFSDSYGLNQYIRSPASAAVDYRGNMLILDYSNGKLWILKAPKGNRQGGDRRLKLLSEFGAQQAMGISVTPSYWQSEKFIDGEQWCYVACFNKQRVHAVKYVSD